MRRICQHNIAGCIGNADPHGNQCGICKQCGEIDKRSKYIVGYRASGTGWASDSGGASGAGGAYITLWPHGTGGSCGARCAGAPSGSHWSLSACWSGRPLWSSGAWAAARKPAAWKPAVTWASVICLGCAVVATAVAVLAIIFRVSSGTWETIVAGAAAITWKTVVSGVSAWSALFYIIISIHSVGKIKIHNYLSLFYSAEGCPSAGCFSLCSK